MRFLDNGLIKLGAEVQTAEEAIHEAGNLLLKEGVVKQTYIDAMLKAYKENDPYFVLASHIAIPHARPEDGVTEASVSLLQLKTPVIFGHQSNDPVQLIFALGAASSDEHLTLLQKLTGLLNVGSNVEKLMNAVSLEEIKNILEMEM